MDRKKRCSVEGYGGRRLNFTRAEDLRGAPLPSQAHRGHTARSRYALTLLTSPPSVLGILLRYSNEEKTEYSPNSYSDAAPPTLKVKMNPKRAERIPSRRAGEQVRLLIQRSIPKPTKNNRKMKRSFVSFSFFYESL